jgi:hypothetical protein
MQPEAGVHDTPANWLLFAPVGFGVVWITKLDAAATCAIARTSSTAPPARTRTFLIDIR